MRLLKSALLVRHVIRRPAAILVAVALGLAACSAPGHGEAPRQRAPRMSRRRPNGPTRRPQVLDAVKAARDIQTLPAAAAAQLTKSNFAEAQHGFDCKPKPAVPSVHFGECTFGDPQGTKLMVMYGDSHADTWAAALEGVAAKHGWKLRVFSEGGCPAPELHYIDPTTRARPISTVTSSTTLSRHRRYGSYIRCSTRHKHQGGLLLEWSWPTSTLWHDAWVSTFQKLTQPAGGHVWCCWANVPSWKNNDVRCLAAHVNDVKVQCCSGGRHRGRGEGWPRGGTGPYSQGDEQSAAAAVGANYVSPQPWICSDQCEPVIADRAVYQDISHLTQAYAEYLTGALGEALQPVLG